MILKPQKGPQERFLATPADICIYGGSAGSGKAQPLSEPVLTPNGFIPMRDIHVGDYVLSREGKPVRVLQEHPRGIQDVYEVTFIDGAKTRCTGDHLWYSKKSKDKSNCWKIRNTSELSELIKKRNFLIPLCEAIEFPQKELKIKPYTLGVLIGDGCLTAPVINFSCPDMEIVERVRQDGYGVNVREKENKCPVNLMIQFSEYRHMLGDMGLLCTSDKKFIPEEYKWNSVEVRRELLRGLFDTDGYVDSQGHISYTSVSERLAKDVQWIVWSLGGKATLTKGNSAYKKNGELIKCKDHYDVYIVINNASDLLTLSRKRNRCVGRLYNGGHGTISRRFKSIEPCGREECKCITVEGDGLYITRDFIVTHNSYAELLTPLRYIDTKGFGAVIFRKNANQIYTEGGLWHEASNMYSGIAGAECHKGEGSWYFKDDNGAILSRISFKHIERDEEVHSYQGSQICCIEYDELTHFSEYIFFYMLSRNRSTCGVKPFIRATCNPDSDSWVANFISWWIDQDTGYPIQERSGKIRWMIRRDNKVFWADSKKELIEQFKLETPEELEEPKSVTFISASIYDNKELLKINPQYLANLKALPEVEREQLLHGNWKIRPSAGLYFKRVQVGNFINIIPLNVQMWCRCWDLAATSEDEKGNPAYTAGVLMGKTKNGRYIIADVINRRMSAEEVRNTIRQTAQQDNARFGNVRVRIPQDPGQAGKDQAQQYIKYMSGFDITAVTETGSKEARATPMAAQWQAGNFDLVVADWNEPYLLQLENFPTGTFKDMVDASANAFAELELRSQFNLSALL